MSIRIYNDASAAVANTGVNRAEQVAGSANSAKSAGAGLREADDRVEISSLSQSLAAADSAESQAARVQQFAALVASGTYSVGSLALSRALISRAAGAGPVESES